MRFYAKRGIYGINATYGRPTNFPLLWEYVFAKLQWNPHQDYMQLEREFIDFYYGKAAPALWKYFSLVHDSHKNGNFDRTLWNGLYPQGFYSEEFTKESLAYFNEAEQTADDKKIRDEIMKEERLFIQDWMSHPINPIFGNEMKAVLNTQLSRLYELGERLGLNRAELLREAYQLPLPVYGLDSGVLSVCC